MRISAPELGELVNTVTTTEDAEDWTFGICELIGSLARRVRDDGWCAGADLGPLPAFADTVVGLVGRERIGRAVPRRLSAFGFTVQAYGPYAQDTGTR